MNDEEIPALRLHCRDRQIQSRTPPIEGSRQMRKLLIAVLTACATAMGGTACTSEPDPATNSTTEPVAAATATPDVPSSNSRGNIEKSFGQEAGIFGDSPDQVVMTFVVNTPKPVEKCESTLAQPQIGKFIEVTITAQTFDDPTGVLRTQPISVGQNWEYIAADGTSTRAQSGVTVFCQPSPPDLRPNRKYNDIKIVLDVPKDTSGGSIVLNYQRGGGGGWEWKL